MTQPAGMYGLAASGKCSVSMCFRITLKAVLRYAASQPPLLKHEV